MLVCSILIPEENGQRNKSDFTFMKLYYPGNQTEEIALKILNARTHGVDLMAKEGPLDFSPRLNLEF